MPLPAPLPRPFARRQRVIRPTARRHVAVGGGVAEDARLQRLLARVAKQRDEDHALGGVETVALGRLAGLAGGGLSLVVGDVGEEVLKACVGHRAPSCRGLRSKVRRLSALLTGLRRGRNAHFDSEAGSQGCSRKVTYGGLPASAGAATLADARSNPAKDTVMHSLV